MIHVAVGVIINSSGQVLIAQRPLHSDQGELWEFPGGKVEVNETVYEALCRELKEELDIEVIKATSLVKLDHNYGSYSVLLDTWIVEQFNGEPQGAEGQRIHWTHLPYLVDFKMLDASISIVNVLLDYIRQQLSSKSISSDVGLG